MNHIIGVVGRFGGAAGASTTDIRERIISVINHFYTKLYMKSTGIGHIDKPYKVYIEKNTLSEFNLPNDCESLTLEEIGFLRPDAVLVFGGDGTMLDVARRLAEYSTPLIGINHGRVGFITDVPRDIEPSLIRRMVAGESTLEVRTMLNIKESNGFSHHDQINALNDVVINRDQGRILEFKVSINGQLAYQSRADGVMVSTPTGSTAYAMAAGGPIIQPSARVFQIIPMMPQTLSYRPIIIDDTAIIDIELIKGSAEVYADGNQIFKFQPGDKLQVMKATGKVVFLHPVLGDELPYNYFNTLRTKLNWHLEPGSK